MTFSIDQRFHNSSISILKSQPEVLNSASPSHSPIREEVLAVTWRAAQSSGRNYKTRVNTPCDICGWKFSRIELSNFVQVLL